MYKKDKQGMIIVLIALTLFLAISIGFKFQSAVIALSIALTVILVQLLSNLHERLTHLEQQFSRQKTPLYSIHMQRTVIYAAALVALVAYINHWMWIAGGALLVLLLCLIQTISAFHTRLLYLESAKQTVHVNETIQTEVINPVIEQVSASNTDTLVPAETAPLAEIILEHRGLAKLKSTYTDRLVEQSHNDTHRVHTSYHQALTATGRLSSSDPNLQNIPIRRQIGRQIRKAFIAPEGRVLLAADYSQIELRLMAHFSQDDALVHAFQHGQDVHRRTAAEVLGIAIEDVTNDQRRQAKAVNFGLLYGMSEFGLIRQLGFTRQESQNYIKQYFQRYPGIYEYMQRTRQVASEQGFVETILGRRLYTPDIDARNVMVRKAAERAAINAPLQGSAADIIKLAMIEVDKILPKDQAKLLLQVHDELVFEADQNIAEELSKQIATVMESVVKISVPLVVEVGQGQNWDDAH